MNNTSMHLNGVIGHDNMDMDAESSDYRHSLFITNAVICGINLTGNVAVIILICQRRLLGRTTNVFVFSLAMADTVCCSGAIPYNVFLALDTSMSVYLCKSYFYALCVSRTAVSYTIVLLTTEKILNILHPSRFITAGRCMFFISLVWFFSAAYNVWTVVFYTIYDSNTVSAMEMLLDPTKGMFGKTCFFSNRFESLQNVFITLDLSVLFILPCVIVLLQFLVIIRKQHGSIKQRIETYFYIMRFLFFIFFVFFGCHLPFEVSTMCKNWTKRPRRNVLLFYDISSTVYYCRGLLNLVVYIYFKQYVCKRKRRLTASNQLNKSGIELQDRRRCRGLSVNEFRLLK